MIEAHEIGLSVSYGNRRFNDALVGLYALADTLDRYVQDFGHVVGREMRVFINDELAKLAARHSGSATTDTALAKRTGTLTSALMKGGTVHDAPKVADVWGQITLPGEYRLQEYGGTIRPTKGEYLFIPLPAALNADGSPRYRNPRQWRATFIAESKAGNLVLLQRIGRKLTPLYALKRVARVRPRLGLVDTVKSDFPAFADRTLTAIFDALTKDLNAT